MDKAGFLNALERYPELQAGLPDHVDELLRIVERILTWEAHPPSPPTLPPDTPEWEKAYWRGRTAVTSQTTASVSSQRKEQDHE